jgi:hypothetical protein
MRTAVIAAVLLSATTASAQPAMTAPMGQPYYQQPAPIAEVKSESTATLLAIGTTVGGFALIGAGASEESGGTVLVGAAMMLIGPSMGHFYAGENGHGIKMSLLRTGAALVLGAGLISQITVACGISAEGEGEGGCGPSRDDRETGKKLMWVGGGTLIAATLYDLWDAHNAAHRANVREARRRYTIAPSIMTGAGGSNVPGLTVAGQF